MIIDIYFLNIVGYAIGKFLSLQLTIVALKMAIANRNTERYLRNMASESACRPKGILMVMPL